MTYRELRKNLQEMDDLRLDDTAIIFDKENVEYLPIRQIKKAGKNRGDLDERHTVLVI